MAITYNCSMSTDHVYSPWILTITVLCLQATYAVSQMVRSATELETHVVSLERVKEYSEIDEEVWLLSCDK